MNAVSISTHEVTHEVTREVTTEMTVDLSRDLIPGAAPAASGLRTPAMSHPAVGSSDEARVWDRLWFSLGERPWATVAVVPASAGQSTLAAANALAAAGRAYHESPVYVLDASSVQPAQVGGLLRAVHERVRGGARIVVATASPIERPATIPVTRGMDTALLVVELGSAEVDASRRAIAAIGAAHFAGAVTWAA